MSRPRRSAAQTPAPVQRGRGRDRHGRGIRSSATGPYLPPLQTRIDTFDMTVASTVDYLRSVWPDELADARFEVAAGPATVIPGVGVERWAVFPQERRIVLYRLPIQRLSRLHRNDDLHRRMVIESCVFRAIAELLGKDPWDLAPDRFRHF
ncbi:metallopeptidase family protein [Cryobacterium sp. TMT1-21]|uniref:Metallopeptidase family protein n=1 Tax=Cryobacterium shii TaxID=1259235 RepID=A0AAQ2HFJ6_9MICO|nr:MULTISPECIES: metallopeptidase family protein [Cryobacterium]TFC48279.1 metallopeptidase family protein [Cryobacterium shii]TFC83802.1 metallopeptidase family protein [Cryobacterium sp. TmT2-59]TFD15451.1 metallopeptidase family protein [Cryobacterium sp. TMT1-21]TFD16656.1 metallopeptidase family protein [Cryobacterium sp. TMT4-10]TFD21885.1 metallopeptidase family protein [Cryobacterium sp. TMT2-23]